MNSTRHDLRRRGATKLVRKAGDITSPVSGGWTTGWQDLHPDMRALVLTDAGLLVCEAVFAASLNNPPQYQIYFRWQVDGVASDTTDMHSRLINYSAAPITGLERQLTCRSVVAVKAGLHRVALQARSDVAATTNTVVAGAAQPLVATIAVL